MDWWSKFYASTGEKNKYGTYLERGYDMLKVRESKLEMKALFNMFCPYKNVHIFFSIHILELHRPFLSYVNF